MNRRNFLASLVAGVTTAPASHAWGLQAIQRVMDGKPSLSDILYLKPELIMTKAGKMPDPWQVEVLRHSGNQLINSSRQRGKSETAAALAIKHAIIKGPCTVLYTSRTLRQVAEFMRRVRSMYAALRAPSAQAADWNGAAELDIEEKDTEFDWDSIPKKEFDEAWGAIPLSTNKSVFQLTLANGSRIVGIPPKEETVRGFTDITLLILDEASRIPDEFYLQSGAYLLVRKGIMVAFTTPFGKRGWFWEAFEGPKSDDATWKRMTITALGCQHSGQFKMCEACRKVSVIRLDEAWIARERRRIGERWHRQEYQCSFEAAAGAIFAHEHIHRTRDDSLAGFDF